MDFGHSQTQVFIGVLLILAAALAALICDLLKGNNESLRELTVELKARREEEGRRLRFLLDQRDLKPRAPAKKVKESKVTVKKAPEAPVVSTAKLVSDRDIPVKRRGEPSRFDLRSEGRRATNDAMAAMERGARRAGAIQGEFEEIPVKPQPRRTPPVEVEPVLVEPTVVASSAVDSSVLDSPVVDSPPAPVAPIAVDSLPAGLQDGHVLAQLVKSRQPVSGLVVSIGISGEPLPDNIAEVIQSLLGPQDFAAQSSNQEYLLIYPGERGAAAQRKLSQIAQQLWDFQLRSLGSLSIQFSWGGVEVRSESIEEAIASATERMQETRRGRRHFNEELLRKAV